MLLFARDSPRVRFCRWPETTARNLESLRTTLRWDQARVRSSFSGNGAPRGAKTILAINEVTVTSLTNQLQRLAEEWLELAWNARRLGFTHSAFRGRPLTAQVQ